MSRTYGPSASYRQACPGLNLDRTDSSSVLWNSCITVSSSDDYSSIHSLHRPCALPSSVPVSGNAGMVSSTGSNLTKETMFSGWFFVLVGFISFLGFLFTAVISKLLHASDNPVLSAIQKDRYYCFLVPLTIPILVVAVYFHWLSKRLFKRA